MKNQKIITKQKTIYNLINSFQKETRAAILFVQSISEITGIHPTDIKCLDYLSEVRSASAGELAKITNLTTGAMTAVIDRLEKANFIRREAHKSDRRKIIVRLIVDNPSHLNLARNLFIKKMPEILVGYSEKELELIMNFNIKLTALLLSETKKMKTLKSKSSV